MEIQEQDEKTAFGVGIVVGLLVSWWIFLGFVPVVILGYFMIEFGGSAGYLPTAAVVGAVVFQLFRSFSEL